MTHVDPTQQEVLESIFQGIKKAQEDYKKAFMRHICSSYAPEYLMTVNIFQSVLELKDKCDCTYGLSLEEPVYDIVKELKRVRELETRGRYPESARVYGNCDLSLLDVNEKPRAVIEVKKYAWDYPVDLGRLVYLIKQDLEFGVFASCWFEEVRNNNPKEAEDRLEEEIQCIYEHIGKDINRLGDNLSVDRVPSNVECLLLEGEEPEQKQEWKWCPVCFVICGRENQW